jgi:hypothetical protein
MEKRLLSSKCRCIDFMTPRRKPKNILQARRKRGCNSLPLPPNFDRDKNIPFAFKMAWITNLTPPDFQTFLLLSTLAPRVLKRSSLEVVFSFAFLACYTFGCTQSLTIKAMYQ